MQTPVTQQPEPDSQEGRPQDHRAERELDALLHNMHEHAKQHETAEAKSKDRIQAFRAALVTEYIPVFVELVEKYSREGLSMQMDASNVLEGGRELRFDFALGDYRSQLHGTVTSEGVAFHEVKYSPDFHGELTAGPMMRIRNLDAEKFREFVCERLALLIRMSLRRR